MGEPGQRLLVGAFQNIAQEYHHAGSRHSLPSAASCGRPAWLGLVAGRVSSFREQPLTMLLFGLVYCIVLLGFSCCPAWAACWRCFWAHC